MKASELIEQLQFLIAAHGDVPVLIQGYESGYDDFNVSTEQVSDFAGFSSFEGRYDCCKTPGREVFLAVVLERQPSDD